MAHSISSGPGAIPSNIYNIEWIFSEQISSAFVNAIRSLRRESRNTKRPDACEYLAEQLVDDLVQVSLVQTAGEFKIRSSVNSVAPELPNQQIYFGVRLFLSIRLRSFSQFVLRGEAMVTL